MMISNTFQTDDAPARDQNLDIAPDGSPIFSSVIPA
jgi:hypothetical protein